MIINSQSPKPINQLKLSSLRWLVAVFFALLLTMTIVSLAHFQSHPAYGQIGEQQPGAIVSCNCVAFRLDDIQDYFLTNAQLAVISTFEQKNAGLTVGIIGNHFGDDMVITGFLRDKLSDDNGFSIEIANHGWNHEDFTLFTKEEQSDLLHQTDAKIMDVLGLKPVVFIAPYNRVNDDTIEALIENDFVFMSANVTNYPASYLRPYQNESNDNNSETTSSSILHFPSSANTGDLNTDNTEWLGRSHEETFAAINTSMDELGYAVVTMHPMEFALRSGTTYQNEVDDRQIRELELLIDDIRDASFEIVPVSQINEGFAAIPEFSSYSIYMILAISVIMVIWLSSKGNNLGLWKNSTH
jgi:peptidoglycan/xylan/chitin deacetylase (PgdA/CDA1 family)